MYRSNIAAATFSWRAILNTNINLNIQQHSSHKSYTKLYRFVNIKQTRVFSIVVPTLLEYHKIYLSNFYDILIDLIEIGHIIHHDSNFES
jgi:hypothetical protein